MSAFEDFLNGPYGWWLILGIIIVFTALTIIYYTKKDKYDPEPPSRLIWAFILGIFSVIPAVILSIIGAFFVGFDPALMSILVAPVMEEIAKLLFVIYLAKSHEFDGPLDGLVYGAMVGAGFAAAENVLYGITATIGDGITTGITLTAIRSVTQIVGHPLYTGLAGIGVGEWKVGLESSKYNKLWRSMLFHGLWNLASNLPSYYLFGGLLIVIVVNIIFLRRELQRALKLDKEAYDRGYYDEKAQRKKMMNDQQYQQIQQWQGGATPIRTSPMSPPPFRSQALSDQAIGKPIEPERLNQGVTNIDSGDSGPNFCRQCGKQRLKGDIFCRNCGLKQI